MNRRSFLTHLLGLVGAFFIKPAARASQKGFPYLKTKTTNFDVAIVGAGLFGSAAARHLAAQSDGIALVGPAEPRDLRQHRGVFASHFDESRLVRVVDPDLVWGSLAKRAIARFREIESQSGIEFYREIGYMMVTPGGLGSDWFNFPAMRRVAADLEIDLLELDHTALQDRFPTLRFTPGSAAILQPRNAGLINPRRLLAAQQKLAAESGAALLREEIVHIKGTGAQLHLQTQTGKTLRANRVLIATGASTNACRLLPRPLQMHIRAAMILLAEVPPQTQLDIPATLYAKTDGQQPFWGLLMPAIAYPDGRFYVKTMDDYYGPRPLQTYEELGDWCRGDGHREHHAILQRALGEVAPSLSVLSTRFQPCLIADTASHYPYIDMVSERIGLAIGGNGKAAKSSDEIGRLAAEMIRTGHWPGSLPANLFKAQFGHH